MDGKGATARGWSDPKTSRRSGTPVDGARRLLLPEEGPPQRAKRSVGARCPEGLQGSLTRASTGE